jgi:hypothetical protein
MMNPITWAVSRVKDMVWRYQFKRTPVTRLGAMLVKNFRGSLYCEGFDNTMLEVISLLKTLPRDSQYGPVLAMLEKLEGPND